jgi:ribosomal-protein-alanine N-acetyltransferase
MPAVVHTDRLDLPSLSGTQMDALLAGEVAAVSAETGVTFSREWLDANRRLLRFRADQLREDPSIQPWLLRPMVLREAAQSAVGTINFHDGPDERGMVEIGYRVLPAYRRLGIAIEAVRGLFAWAITDPRVQVFRASVSPSNVASLGLIAKLGFTQVGEQIDEEDGMELVFEVPASAFRSAIGSTG